LPKDYKDDGKPKLVSQTTGDQGVEWLRRALRRIEEQAREENRSMEIVAAERYGVNIDLFLIDKPRIRQGQVWR